MKKKHEPTDFSNVNIPTIEPPPIRKNIFHSSSHTITKKFLKNNSIFFPQYIYYQTTNNDQLNFVDEHSLVPTLSSTSHYQFTNPSALPFYNNPADNELCQSRLEKLTTAPQEKQFTIIGLNQSLNRFVAPRANRISIIHYEHAFTRYM